MEPVARVDVVVEERFGVRLVDPYRWMEDEGPELAEWMAGQGAYAREVLGALPGRVQLADRIAELADRTPQYGELASAGGRVFLLRRDPGADVAVLVVHDDEHGERVLLDPAGEADGPEHATIDWYVPSPDGGLVACAVARGGSEHARLRIVEVDTGALLPDVVDEVLLPHLSWLPGEPAFYYHRYRDQAGRRDGAAYRHRVGTDQADDPLVLARGTSPDVPMTPLDRPFVHAAGDHLLAVVSAGAVGSTTSGLSGCAFHVGGPDGRWRRLAGPDDDVVAFTVAGDRLLLVRYGREPRGEVLAVPVADPDLARADVLVPAGDRVIESVTPVDDVVLVRELEDGRSRLRRVPLGGGRPEEVPVPVDGTVLDVAAGPDRTALLLTTSWTEPTRLHRYDPDSGAVEDTGWLPVPPAPVELVATERLVPARDGESVPLSVVHRRGLALDGRNPTVLTGYGSYGHVLRPRYLPELAAWFERGGVYAVAHLRGGGERGRDWHRAGRLLRRETTITDFLDCAEHLVAAGWTSPDRLAAEGGSAGAVPVGGRWCGGRSCSRRSFCRCR